MLTEKEKKLRREYNMIDIVRAKRQLEKYRKMDIANGFGDVIDFDEKWIVSDIYAKKCVHCGESDWHKLGCNRINNSKPHTIDNVEPCCYRCNVKLYRNEAKKAIDQIDKVTGEVVYTWESATDAAKELGYSQGNINNCCIGRGYCKTYKGFVWKYGKKEES